MEAGSIASTAHRGSWREDERMPWPERELAFFCSTPLASVADRIDCGRRIKKKMDSLDDDSGDRPMAVMTIHKRGENRTGRLRNAGK